MYSETMCHRSPTVLQCLTTAHHMARSSDNASVAFCTLCPRDGLSPTPYGNLDTGVLSSCSGSMSSVLQVPRHGVGVN